jgi:hypothetical protein
MAFGARGITGGRAACAQDGGAGAGIWCGTGYDG